MLVEERKAPYLLRSYDELGLPPVLVHGDPWVHNILFRKEGGVSSDLSAIIDWQMLHLGTVAEDVAILLVSSLKTDLRLAETKNVLRYYYDKLTEKMKGRGCKSF